MPMERKEVRFEPPMSSMSSQGNVSECSREVIRQMIAEEMEVHVNRQTILVK